jgi:hypothetical protein
MASTPVYGLFLYLTDIGDRWSTYITGADAGEAAPKFDEKINIVFRYESISHQAVFEGHATALDLLREDEFKAEPDRIVEVLKQKPDLFHVTPTAVHVGWTMKLAAGGTSTPTLRIPLDPHPATGTAANDAVDFSSDIFLRPPRI